VHRKRQAGFTCLEKKKIYDEVRKVDKSAVIDELGRRVGWLEPIRTKAEKHWPFQIYTLYTIFISSLSPPPPPQKKNGRYKYDLLLKGITSPIEYFFGSDFIEASMNIILNFLHRKTSKNCDNYKSSFKKYFFEF
jgi:hypothetical protein